MVESKFCGHAIQPALLKGLPVGIKSLTESFLVVNNGKDGIGQLDKVPLTNMWLVAKTVSPPMRIGGVGSPARIIVLQPTVGTVVNGETENGHIIGVHDAMDETNPHPMNHQLRCFPADFAEPGEVGCQAWLPQVGKIRANGIVEKLLEKTIFATGGEDLKITETNERRRHPADNGPGFILWVAIVEHVTLNQLSRCNQAQGPGGRDSEMIHGFTAEILPDGGAENGQAIGCSRIGSWPRSFELQNPAFVVDVDDFTEIDSPAIAQLPRPVTELVTTVAHGEGIHTGGQRVACKNLEKLLRLAHLPAHLKKIGNLR